MKTLITGSTGQLGSATIDFLLAKKQQSNIVALVRNEDKAQSLQAKGVETRVGNYDDYDSLLKATEGMDTILLISSSEMVKSRAVQHINVIKAAKENGVKHIIYTGFMRTHEDPSSPLWFIAKDHVETENYLKESGLKYTLFENGYYMDMLMGFVGENVLETKTIYVPAGGGKVNFVLRNEIAEALANVITTPGHENKVYNIGTEKSVSFAEIAQMISNLSGVSVQYVSPEPDEYKEKLMEMGMEKMWAEMLTAFAVAFAANTMNIETTDLTKLLGRKPTDVQAFLKNLFSK